MKLQGFRPLQKGEVSILAAFTLVVLLAGAGLFFQSFSPINQQSQTAAPADVVPLPKPKPVAPDPVTEACKTALAAAKQASGKNTSKTGQTGNDNCVAAILTTDSAYKDPPYNGYRCVGKNAQISIDSNKRININSILDGVRKMKK